MKFQCTIFKGSLIAIALLIPVNILFPGTSWQILLGIAGLVATLALFLEPDLHR